MPDTHPLLILAIGMATVIGLIIGLRINAFLAMITAAIVVSLLSPGDPAAKISRVAAAFGAAAGNIGIVIALAAVVGKCLMDSGAADRIVRAFVGVLGERRSATALMGSGFVLAVPVFFDTVFYLLVPLARSLHRRTRTDYLKYLLAISAGGAVTHTGAAADGRHARRGHRGDDPRRVHGRAAGGVRGAGLLGLAQPPHAGRDAAAPRRGRW
jgi:GntP family gluconate:H+ symporter